MQQSIFNGRGGAAVARRVVLGATVATALAAAPAIAAEGPDLVRPGNNITVFHNIDMIAVFGHQTGGQVRIDVMRGAHRVASVQGEAVDTPEGGALEVNHGPVGPPVAGDCFVDATPDIRPGDRIRVTNPGGEAGVDDAIVDEITMTGRATVTVDGRAGAPTNGQPIVADTFPNADPATGTHPGWRLASGGGEIVGADPTQAVEISGSAFYMNADGQRGDAIPLAELNSAEFLGVGGPLNDNQLRMAPNQVVAGAAEGSYVARYWDQNGADDGGFPGVDRNRNGIDDEDILAGLTTGEGHAMGYGHVAPLPLVSMLVDGFGEQAGPALGCEGSPKVANALGTVSTTQINAAHMAPLADGDTALSLGGWAAGDVADATVELRRGAGAPLSVDVTGLSGGVATDPQQGWTANVTKAQLVALGEGTLTAQLVVGGANAGPSKTIEFDTVAPTFTLSHDNGSFVGTQSVTVTPGAANGATDEIRYTLNGGNSVAYTGTGITLSPRASAHSLVVTASDAAGNTTVVNRTITVTAPAGSTTTNQQQTTQAAATQSAPAPAPLAPVQLAAPSRTVTMVARMLSGQRRVSGAKARKSGLTARFSAPSGARNAVIKVYRQKSGKLTLIGTQRSKAKVGRNSVALKSKALRRKLTSGLYVIEVTLSGANGKAGQPSTSFMRVLR